MTITASIPLRKLERDEKIQFGDLHSMPDHHEMHTVFRPLMHPDSIGQTPNDFAKCREFWRII